MRSSTGSECAKSLIKLKRQEDIIEKTLDYFFDNMKLEPETLRALTNERNSRMLDRRKLESTLRGSVFDIRKRLREIKSMIKHMQEDQQIDVDSLREKLVSLANKLREFKNESSMAILANEEIELDRNLVVFSLALTKYENPPSNQCEKSVRNTVADFRDYKGSKDFDSFIAKTGHTQDWSESDHLLFVKVRKTNKDIESMVSAMTKKCPDLTPERIVNHEAWYKIYLDLREKQRNAIREWRENRVAKKREEIDDISGVKSCDFEKNEGTSRGSETNDCISNPLGLKVNGPRAKNNERCTNERRESIKKWREERERRNRIEIEKSKSELMSRRVWRENRRLTRARAVKTAALAYREKKMENAASTSSPTSSFTDFEQTASKSNVKMIRCFRQQDEEFLKRRKTMMEQKNSRPHSASCAKVDSRCSIKTSTLLNPTKVWLERCKAAKNSEGEVPSQTISYVKYIPKLGSCNWKNRESR